MIAVAPLSPAESWALVAAAMLLAGLASWGLCRLMARLTPPPSDDHIRRFAKGSSLSWAVNDEDRAQVGARPVSAPTPLERNGR